MLKRGRQPRLECSSRGEKRFSAFYARIQRRGGDTIEAIYQANKVFEDGSTGLHWKAAKGRQAVNQDECQALYDLLWREYLEEKPELWDMLLQANGLQDCFGQEGHACQADTLWNLRNERLTQMT
jgi:hypothetical protein